MTKTSLSLSIALVLCSANGTAATLQLGDHLSIEAGSNFVWADTSLPVAITGYNGLTVGPAAGNTGSGSHGGSPVAGDVGAVTNPWEFFSNTGYDFLATDHGSGSFGGDTTNGVDMTSWTMTWNGVADTILGGCFLVAGGCTVGGTVHVDTGIGVFNWSGVYGDTYTISYIAHGPMGSADGFSGGLKYDLFLTGVVTAVPIPAAVWLFGSGLLGLSGLARINRRN